MSTSTTVTAERKPLTCYTARWETDGGGNSGHQSTLVVSRGQVSVEGVGALGES
jgi:hypothetical protein